ncbi:Acg family FMN-binding oxidoreductase [Pseudonocardia abyssalis]|uniref:NAD(P)H nitroreductase n=1 Tax=Pseudonocardia abyssalis TaxID=2792008 RepID=A0ABS6UPD8_9PSEU|nr:NAD(P)H nitroreductase [Pseudonocardia abyssalis]MBW0115092.1 NAD(P)H nitroreductase [Pseudonocardia abyssalis]MBW0133768.1 NAD(P)H nitroreductase [Pseudonocardia abyssalis]
MIVEHVDHRSVRSALELATRAPSIHNSQPWRWLLGPRSIHLYADLRRWLPVTDADGRDLAVSCGAALHHLTVALAATGLRCTVHRLPNPADGDHFAAVELRAGPVAAADLGTANAIVARRTDRRRYLDWEVPEAFVGELTDRAAEFGAVLRPVTGAARDRTVAALRAAARAQEDLPGYHTETTVWTGGRSGDDGVPAANLLRDADVSGDGTARWFSEGLIAQTDGGKDGALLMVLGTASDDTLSQLRAGEALSAVLLHATQLGLASCPLSQPLEVTSTRAMLRDDVLGGTLDPQLVLRVGWAPTGSPLPPTPRRALDDSLERMPQ